MEATAQATSQVVNGITEYTTPPTTVEEMNSRNALREMELNNLAANLVAGRI